jgi:hypothetical protein
MTPCEKCSKCINEVQSTVQAFRDNSTTTVIASGVAAWCAGSGRSNTVCKALQAAVAASYRGNLGRRAAAICSRLSDCSADVLAAGSSCTVTVGAASSAAAVDTCTVEGTAGGTSITGITVGSSE